MTRKELLVRFMEAAMTGSATIAANSRFVEPSEIAKNACDIAVAGLGEIERRFTKQHLYEDMRPE